MSEESLSPGCSAMKVRKDTALANRVAAEAKGRWRQGEAPDVARVLAEHPELKRYKSIVLDLAHYEYRLRLEAGEGVAAADFVRRFPTLRRSLYLLIEVHKLMDFDPDLEEARETVWWPQPGESFLGFSLIGELGRGAFARVFLASQPALGNRLVAVKVAPRGGKEAELLGRLHHPGIVPVFSVEEDATTGLTAVCMPYLGRATLGDVLDTAFEGPGFPRKARIILEAIRVVNDPEMLESALPDRVLRKGAYVDGVLHLAIQITDALAYAHSQDVCHRDLKPSNILMSPAGRPLLLDFNLSVDERENASRMGGTVPYMAPEQLRSVIVERSRGQQHAGPRSDLFSLGVILYELLCGCLPFGSIPWKCRVDELAEHLLCQQQRGPRPIRRRNEQVDRRLAQLIEDCLAFDPEHRPASAEDLAGWLYRQFAPVARGKRWGRNHPRQVFLMAFVLGAFLLSMTGFLAFRDPYSVRQFERGRWYLEHDKHELAIGCLDQAIRYNPGYSDALFARAQAYQELGAFRLAFEDYNAAFRLAPMARTAACKGYCLNRLKYHEEAIQCYLEALDLGFSSPRLLNNLGFSYLQLGRLEDAEKHLKQAVAADEDLQVAHYNLVMVSIEQARGGQPVQRTALLHVRRAIETGPPSTDLYRDAAYLYALAAKQDRRLARQAVECLEKAVAHGFNPAYLNSDPVFSSLHGNPEFDRLCRGAANTKAPSKAVRLVDPL